MEKNYLREFWDYVEQEKEKTKIGKRVWNWLDHDNLGSILVEYGTWTFELVCRQSTYPEYVHQYIKRFMKRKGYDYFYDVKNQ